MKKSWGKTKEGLSQHRRRGAGYKGPNRPPEDEETAAKAGPKKMHRLNVGGKRDAGKGSGITIDQLSLDDKPVKKTRHPLNKEDLIFDGRHPQAKYE